jgi:hypothetical protein
MKNFLLTVFLLLLYGILVAAEDDLRRVRALSEQGLFAAAEAFCNEKLQQPDLTEINKIRLATELVHAYSQQLLLLESAQRTRIVRRLESFEKEWLAPPAGSAVPDLVLAKIMLRLQLAMTYHSLGDDQRIVADTVSETNNLTACREARSTLEDVLERLKKGQQELQNFRQKIGINADSSLQQRMLALDYSITMQRGIAQKSLALTFSAETDRNSELRQAVQTFSELTAMNSTDPVIVQCKIEKAVCHRLGGELDRCAEILQPLRDVLDSFTPECRLRTEAEWIRYNIATGNVADTRKQYTADRADVKLYPDFDLARLELLLTNDPTRNIRPEIPAAMKLEQTIDQQLGSYWGRRARMTALSFGNMEFNSAEMLVMRAEKHYQEQQFIESAELYEQAAAKADTNHQADARDRYRRLAAHAWGKALEPLPLGEPKIKAQRRLIALLRNLAVHNLEDSEALDLHLWAINTQVEIVLSQPEALDDYLTLVAEHAKYWNDSPQLQRIRRLSVILLECQGRWDEVSAMLPLLDLEQLKTLPPEIQRFRVRQLDSAGKTQEAVNLLATLLKQKSEPATLKLFAEILTRQSEVKSLEYALKYWTELTQNVERNSEMWWAAREGIFEVLLKSNRREEAKKEFETLRILYPALGGAERSARLIKQFE